MSEYFKRETLENLLDKIIKDFDDTGRKFYSEIICVAGQSAIKALRDTLGKLPADRVDAADPVQEAVKTLREYCQENTRCVGCRFHISSPYNRPIDGDEPFCAFSGYIPALWPDKAPSEDENDG